MDWLTVFNDPEHRGASELFDPGVAVSANLELLGRVPPGLAGLKAVLGFLRGPFPDLTFTALGKPVGQGAVAVYRWRARGTHQGKLFNVGPTGKPVELSGMCMTRTTDGRIDALWLDLEFQEALSQMGMAPAVAPR